MNHHQYHCLIAGLPDLSLGDPVECISVPAFRRVLEEELFPEDFEQVRLVFLRDDHRNLVRFIETGEVDPDSAGNYTYEDFRDQFGLFSSIIPQEDILPPYMVRVMKEFHEMEQKADPVQISHALAGDYLEYVLEHGCRFLRAYIRFEYDLDNLLTYLEAGRHDMERGRYITGRTPHAEHLRQSLSHVLERDPEFEYFDEILSRSEITSIAERELRFDAMRWEKIDELIFFEDFDINRILGYLFKVMIVMRWSGLTRQKGESRIRGILRRTEAECFTPED